MYTWSFPVRCVRNKISARMILYLANSKPTAVLRGSCYPQLYLKNPPPHHFKTSTRTPSTNLFHLWVTRAGPRCKFSFAHHLRRGCVAPDETKLDNRLPTALTDSFSFHLVLAASGLRCVVAVFTRSFGEDEGMRQARSRRGFQTGLLLFLLLFFARAPQDNQVRSRRGTQVCACVGGCARARAPVRGLGINADTSQFTEYEITCLSWHRVEG